MTAFGISLAIVVLALGLAGSVWVYRSNGGNEFSRQVVAVMYAARVLGILGAGLTFAAFVGPYSREYWGALAAAGFGWVWVTLSTPIGVRVRRARLARAAAAGQVLPPGVDRDQAIRWGARHRIVSRANGDQ